VLNPVLTVCSPATVACVVKVDNESMRVLDQNGSVRTILPSQVSNKIEPRKNAVATDRNGSEVRIGDTAKDLYGDNQKGEILHIYRSFLFLHDKEQLENSGIFVARSTNVMTVAAKGGRATANVGPNLSKMNPALQRNGMNGNSVMAPPKSMGRDRLMGQTVSIRKGPHKGLMGIVKDTTDTQARVELHTKAKIVTVDKEILGMKECVR
jgi:transcription elongation factor SPT5